MTRSETLIVVLLVFIVYFLYQIARQLSYLTGKRIKLRFPRIPTPNFRSKKPDEPKLPN